VHIRRVLLPDTTPAPSLYADRAPVHARRALHLLRVRPCREVRVFVKSTKQIYFDAVSVAFENFQNKLYKTELQLTPAKRVRRE